MKKGFVIWLLFVVVAGFSFGFLLIALRFNKVEWASFAITVLAFFAAGYAIYLQKEATLKQEIIGAWQVLANKASGNSGKKEAIEFLASQGLSLCGIDMSKKTHGGKVYLADLFKDFEGDRSKIDLRNANFSGADLKGADFSKASLLRAKFPKAKLFDVNFSGAILRGADFSGADLMCSVSSLKNAKFSRTDLSYAKFSRNDLMEVKFSRTDLSNAKFLGTCLFGAKFSETNLFMTDFSLADLWAGDSISRAKLLIKANFSKVKMFDDKSFINCYCWFDNIYLPKPPPGYKFEFEERTDENNQPIYPENNPDYRYIKLIKLK